MISNSGESGVYAEFFNGEYGEYIDFCGDFCEHGDSDYLGEFSYFGEIAVVARYGPLLIFFRKGQTYLVI